MACALPYAELATLFLDAGNTLVSIDFEWVAHELGARGAGCDAASLERAEAAARPRVSAALARGGSTEGEDAFSFYLRNVLERLPDPMDDALRAELVRELAPVLRGPDGADRLWSRVIPGVPEALAALRAAGLQLVVVSNSDGTVDRGLTAVGLRQHLDAVVDSHRVGFEKPDPRIFQHAIERSGADPRRTLHVGDLYDADVVGARAAGLHALLLDPFGDWEGVPCARLPDLPALAALILRNRG